MGRRKEKEERNQEIMVNEKVIFSKWLEENERVSVRLSRKVSKVVSDLSSGSRVLDVPRGPL